MNKKELLDFSRKYAKSQGFKLNPDKKVLNKILDALLLNEKNEKFRYCPCKVHIMENICPCKAHKQEIKEWGHCKCTLFWKENNIIKEGKLKQVGHAMNKSDKKEEDKRKRCPICGVESHFDLKFCPNCNHTIFS